MKSYPRIKFAAMGASLVAGFLLGALCLGAMATARAEPEKEAPDFKFYAVTIQNTEGSYFTLYCTTGQQPTVQLTPR